MAASDFITINEQDTLSLAQAFRFLQQTGELDSFVSSILKQYVLDREFRQNPKLAIAPTLIDDKVLEFRRHNDILDSFVFREWLERQNLDESQLYQQITADLKLQKLKEILAENRLQEYFIERKLFLDQVILSRLVVSDPELAAELHSQILDGGSFEALAREYSITEDRFFNGMFGSISRGSLPDNLRAAIDVAAVGSLLKPMEIEEIWYIFRLEHTMPATLDDPNIQKTLMGELLEQWFVAQLQTLDINIQVGDDF